MIVGRTRSTGRRLAPRTAVDDEAVDPDRLRPQRPRRTGPERRVRSALAARTRRPTASMPAGGRRTGPRARDHQGAAQAGAFHRPSATPGASSTYESPSGLIGSQGIPARRESAEAVDVRPRRCAAATRRPSFAAAPRPAASCTTAQIRKATVSHQPTITNKTIRAGAQRRGGGRPGRAQTGPDDLAGTQGRAQRRSRPGVLGSDRRRGRAGTMSTTTTGADEQGKIIERERRPAMRRHRARARRAAFAGGAGPGRQRIT